MGWFLIIYFALNLQRNDSSGNLNRIQKDVTKDCSWFCEPHPVGQFSRKRDC